MAHLIVSNPESRSLSQILGTNTALDLNTYDQLNILSLCYA